MVTVEEYFQYVETEVFQPQLAELKKLVTVEDIRKWQQRLSEMIAAKEIAEAKEIKPTDEGEQNPVDNDTSKE